LYVAPEAAGSYPSAETLPVIERPWTDFSQGLLRPTGNPLDFALSGPGFFAVNGPNGPLYTRDGSFRISTAGLLVTAEGYTVRDTTGAPLELTSGTPVQMTPDGELLQDGQPAGQLAILSFARLASLEKQGYGYFRVIDATAKPAPAQGFELRQETLENSNASSAEAAVRLVTVMRQFEMLQKAVLLGVEMNRRALEEVAHM